MFADIENRSYRLQPYGLALTKMVARRSGINPIWYVDISQGHPWKVRNALNRLVESSVAGGRSVPSAVNVMVRGDILDQCYTPSSPTGIVIVFVNAPGAWADGFSENDRLQIDNRGVLAARLTRVLTVGLVFRALGEDAL